MVGSSSLYQDRGYLARPNDNSKKATSDDGMSSINPFLNKNYYNVPAGSVPSKVSSPSAPVFSSGGVSSANPYYNTVYQGSGGGGSSKSSVPSTSNDTPPQTPSPEQQIQQTKTPIYGEGNGGKSIIVPGSSGGGRVINISGVSSANIPSGAYKVITPTGELYRVTTPSGYKDYSPGGIPLGQTNISYSGITGERILSKSDYGVVENVGGFSTGNLPVLSGGMSIAPFAAQKVSKEQSYQKQEGISYKKGNMFDNLYFPKQRSTKETMDIQKFDLMGLNFEKKGFQYSGVISARSTSDFSLPKDTQYSGLKSSERFFYKAEKYYKEEEIRGQIGYAKSAGIGFGVGVLKFGRDIIGDITGEGLTQVPLKSTATGAYKTITDFPGTVSQIVSKAQEDPYQTAGYVLAPTIFGKIAPVSREGFIRVTSKNIPATKPLSSEALLAVESGKPFYPATSSVESLYKSFSTSVSDTGDIRVVTASPKPLSTAGQSRVISIGESEFGKLNRESTGLYVSPYGEGNPSFFKIIKSDEYSKISLFPKISRPTLSVIDVPKQSFGRIPSNILSKGIESENIFLKSQPNKLFLTGNVERAFNPSFPGRSTAEFESVITPKSTISSSSKSILGYEENIVVSGRVVPLRTYKLSSKIDDYNVVSSKKFYDFSGEGFRYSEKYKSYIYEVKPSLSLSTGSSIFSYSKSFSGSSMIISGSSPLGTTRSSFVESPSRSFLEVSPISSVSKYPSSPSYYEFPLASRSSLTKLPSYISTPSRSSSITAPSYPSTISRVPYRPYPITPNYPVYSNIFGRDTKKGKSKREKKQVFSSFGGFKDSNVYILPDLMSVSKTESSNFFKFGGGEAIAPRATKKVKSLSYAAFSGLSAGFVPTEQERKKLRI